MEYSVNGSVFGIFNPPFIDTFDFWELVRFLGGPAPKKRWSKSCWLRYFFMIWYFPWLLPSFEFCTSKSIGKQWQKRRTALRVNLQLNYEFSMNFARLMRTSLLLHSLSSPLIRPHSLLSGVALLHERLRLKFHILYAVNHRPLASGYYPNPFLKTYEIMRKKKKRTVIEN